MEKIIMTRETYNRIKQALFKQKEKGLTIKRLNRFTIPIKEDLTTAQILRELFLEIEHGDQEHRSWLKNKIEDFIKQRGYE